jgi:tetratricopeptide (TPR) repeat protein
MLIEPETEPQPAPEPAPALESEPEPEVLATAADVGRAGDNDGLFALFGDLGAQEEESTDAEEKDATMPHRVCWICLEHEPDESGDRLLPTGCACRGSSAGFAHVGCLATASQHAARPMWQTCPTCEQDWTGPMYFELCRRRSLLAADRPQDDLERLTAASGLAEALVLAGQYEEALRLGQDTHAVVLQTHGADHPLSLRSASIIADAHTEIGDHEAALPLKMDWMLWSRRVHGDEHEETLNAIGSLARTHHHMGHLHLALPLYQEALDMRRTMGSAHEDTLLSCLQLASALEGVCEFQRALPLRNEAVQGYRRLLGSQHEHTLDAVGRLGQLHCNMGDHAAAVPLLHEAVEGLSALPVGGAHASHQLDVSREQLYRTTQCLEHPAAAAASQQQLRWIRLDAEAQLPSVAATVVGVQSHPELNGTQVTTKKYLKDKGRYVVQLPPGADGKQEKIHLKPANLVLAAGSAVVATGLVGAPELNGRKGRVMSWDVEAGRYAIRLDGESRPKRLKPDSCRADVLAL